MYLLELPKITHTKVDPKFQTSPKNTEEQMNPSWRQCFATRQPSFMFSFVLFISPKSQQSEREKLSMIHTMCAPSRGAVDRGDAKETQSLPGKYQSGYTPTTSIQKQQVISCISKKKQVISCRSTCLRTEQFQIIL
jgi:hypothetical protein